MNRSDLLQGSGRGSERLRGRNNKNGGHLEMSVNGIGAGYPAWRDMGKAQRNGSGTGFAGRMADADAAGSGSSVRNSVKTAGQTSVLDAYRASAASGVRNVKPAYDTYRIREF